MEDLVCVLRTVHVLRCWPLRTPHLESVLSHLDPVRVLVQVAAPLPNNCGNCTGNSSAHSPTGNLSKPSPLCAAVVGSNSSVTTALRMFWGRDAHTLMTRTRSASSSAKQGHSVPPSCSVDAAAVPSHSSQTQTASPLKEKSLAGSIPAASTYSVTNYCHSRN